MRTIDNTTGSAFNSGTEYAIKCQIVELIVPANSTLNRFQFTDQPFLRSKQIHGIEIFSVNDLTASPLGNTLPTSANLSTAYITLYSADPENPNSFGTWVTIPMWSLHNLNNGTDPFAFSLYKMEPRSIIWEKSVISTNASLGNTDQLSWVLNVSYSGILGDN